MKKFAAALTLFLLVPLLLSGCGPEALVLYTDLDAGDAAKLVAPFTDKTGMQVEIVEFKSSAQMVDAVSPPQRRGDEPAPTPPKGRKPADVILTADMLAMTELAGREALESYMPQEAAALPYGANGGGWWYGFGGRGWVLIWNTDLVKKQPDGFQDLADAAYPIKGVSLPNPERDPFYPLAVYSLMGRDYTIGLYRTMMQNEAYFTGSPTEAAGRVARGLSHVGITTYEAARERADEGDPVSYAFPDQDPNCMGAWVEFYSAGIAKGSRNLKAARKLDDWLLSAEAEALTVELGLSDVTLRDAGSGAPVVIPLKVDPAAIVANGPEAQQAFERMVRDLGR